MKLGSVFLALGLAVASVQTGVQLLDGSPHEGVDEHTSHYADGGREEWAEYLDGRRHGACKRWYRDGTLRAEGRFEHGQRVGAWRWYEPDGSLDRARSGTYEDGRKVAD